MNLGYLVCFLAIGVLVGCGSNASPEKAVSPGTPAPTSPQPGVVAIAPVQELECMGMSDAGETGDGVFGTTQSGLETWVWKEGKMCRGLAAPMPPLGFNFIGLSKNRYLGYVYPRSGPGSRSRLFLGSSQSGEVVPKWMPPEGWKYDTAYNLGASVNGKFAAVILEEDVGGKPPPAYNRANPRYRIGLIDLATLELRWVGELSGHGSGTIRQIAVSDDGKYMAVGGWNNGIALVDASQGKVLWKGRPPTEVSTGYVVFSSDGLTLYSAGSEGCVYTMDTKTGKITGQWWATETGQSIYGHRISCLTKSPDGQWVAAGTGPEGQVYLFSTASPGKPLLLPHGRATAMAVSFSPDSKYLASVGGGRIKVWNITGPSPISGDVK